MSGLAERKASTRLAVPVTGRGFKTTIAPLAPNSIILPPFNENPEPVTQSAREPSRILANVVSECARELVIRVTLAYAVPKPRKNRTYRIRHRTLYRKEFRFAITADSQQLHDDLKRISFAIQRELIAKLASKTAISMRARLPKNASLELDADIHIKDQNGRRQGTEHIDVTLPLAPNAACIAEACRDVARKGKQLLRLKPQPL